MVNEDRESQFQRAMRELGVELIHARSPQAKGRVERANGILQDRLIKMMRLRGISSIEEGNRFLEEFREAHNKKFGKLPVDGKSAHRSCSKKVDLDRILSVKEKRKISKNLTIQYNNSTYQLVAKGRERRLMGKEITVLEMKEGKIAIEYQGEKIRYNIHAENPRQSNTVMDSKEMVAYLDRKKPMTAIQRHRRKVSRGFNC